MSTPAPFTAVRLPDAADGPAAKAYILRHDKRVKRIDPLRVPALRALYRAVLDVNKQTLVHGGPVEHDELVDGIINIEFPDVSRAREVYADTCLVRLPALGQE